MGKLFGTDGIRGVANAYPMDVETALLAGKAVASHFGNGHQRSKRHIVIGQDTRLSGDMLVQAVAAGACAAGVDVRLLGVLPTPGIAHMTVAAGAVAGIVISASHNPYQDNGIKVFDSKGYKLSDETEARLESLMISGARASLATHDAIGRTRLVGDATDHYLEFLKKASASGDLRKMTIVLDCANGATFQAAPELFRRLGACVISLFCRPDGLNINDGCGSQHPEQLAQSVVVHKADVGLAFDGDGDRLIAVDETGRVMSGDQIMAVCAKDLKQRGGLKNNVVVSTVMSNMGLHLALKQMDIRLHTTQVGDRYVMEKMIEAGAVLGGEDSGHMIFRDRHTTGDGMMAALHLLDAMQSARKPLSELSKVMTVFPQILINVDIKEKPDIESVPEIAQAIAEAEKRLGDQGRVLVRYSGTQNICRVMVEGPTEAQTQALCSQISEIIRKTIGES